MTDLNIGLWGREVAEYVSGGAERLKNLLIRLTLQVLVQVDLALFELLISAETAHPLRIV